MSWEAFEGGWRLAPAAGAARALVVLLHGVGSNARDLTPLADVWRDALPDVAFVRSMAASRSMGALAADSGSVCAISARAIGRRA